MSLWSTEKDLVFRSHTFSVLNLTKYKDSWLGSRKVGVVLG